MLAKVILIIDKRKEQSIKYKKMFDSKDSAVFVSSNIAAASTIVNNFEPDLILLSDSIDDNVEDTIRKLRIISYNTRPVLIVLSKSDHMQDRVDALNAGADDFLSEPIEQEEFKARISAHLRRHFENNIEEKTRLLDFKISQKILKRTINKKDAWAALLIDIDNFDFYKEIYGELASDKMLQTYTAIMRTTLDENDYLGLMGDKGFLIITNPLKAEIVANYLIHAFNTVVSKFYSDKDAKRGYIMLNGDEKAGNKVSLVSTSIGIISNEYKHYSNIKQVINSLHSVQKLARLKSGSGYVFERPKLSAKDSIAEKEFNSKILIIEPDEALSLLLDATVAIQGYEPLVINDYSDVFNLPSEVVPAVIILDAGNTSDLKGIELCKIIKSDKKYENSSIILTTTLHDKQTVLSAGADFYLPKPYELSVILGWIEKFVKKFNY